MTMTNEELNTALYKKMFAEQEKFRDWLLSQPPEEILYHAYEFTVRADILLSLEYRDLTDAQAKVLLTSPDTMGDLFTAYEHRETDYMDTVWDAIEGRADEMLEAQQEMLQLPVYPHNASYAKEHGEMDDYNASLRANLACRDAIEQAIADNYKNYCLGERAAQQVVEQFGYDRPLYVLANTVREKDWDGRISRENKAWAKTVPIPANPSPWGGDYNRNFLVDRPNPGLLDIFLTQIRKEQAQQEKKPSVREKLTVQPTKNAPKISAKSKGQER